MRYYVRSLALAVMSVVAIGAWVVRSEANGSANIRPLSAAEQRATWGTGGCDEVAVVPNVVCKGALRAPCFKPTIFTCSGTCRDGCTPINNLRGQIGGDDQFGFSKTVNCGTPGLGSTYNVRNCNLFTCCTGTITGTFACNGVNVIVWHLCGPGPF